MAFALLSMRDIFLQAAPHRVRFHTVALLGILLHFDLLLYKRSPRFPTRRQKAQSRRPVRIQNRGVRAAVSWRRSLNPVVAKDYRRPPTFRPISESSVECPRVIGMGQGIMLSNALSKSRATSTSLVFLTACTLSMNVLAMNSAFVARTSCLNPNYVG